MMTHVNFLDPVVLTSENLPLDSLLHNSVYYPASGYDGDMIRLFNKILKDKGVRSFVYCGTHEEPGMAGTVIPLADARGGVKVVCMEINGQPLKMAIDTGAPLSYVDRMVTDDLEPIGEKADFHPKAGRYTTPVFKLEAEICGKKFTGAYGNLPTMMGLSLKLGGLDGVVGYDFFKSFKVLFDFRNSLVVSA